MREDPDMPVFTLIGKDVLAVNTVQFWLAQAKEAGVNPQKIAKVQEHLDALIRFKLDNPDRMQVPD